MSELRLITAPTTSPVTMAEARAHLRDTDDDNISEIALKLKAAIAYCQSRVSGHRQFMSATYDLTMAEFPAEVLEIPLPPLNNISWVKYYDTDGALQTWGSTTGSTGSTGYFLTIKSNKTPGYIVLAYNKSWPSTRDRPDAVQVRFVAGSTAATTVDDSVKAAVLLKLEHLYDPDRVDESQQNRAIDSLLAGVDYGHYG